ncbi:hypothetical protein TcasGA2_TC016217 [Tribolium castaneum]|uniref:Uncharacterized protein n=1 Tax=Tribolium castaneum TaxID=7070 RepID=D6X4P2_TRICA|nr:hypothetical protein TcasGA2_TC016217 [Tribolium castaneum]
MHGINRSHDQHMHDIMRVHVEIHGSRKPFLWNMEGADGRPEDGHQVLEDDVLEGGRVAAPVAGDAQTPEQEAHHERQKEAKTALPWRPCDHRLRTPIELSGAGLREALTLYKPHRLSAQ